MPRFQAGNDARRRLHHELNVHSLRILRQHLDGFDDAAHDDEYDEEQQDRKSSSPVETFCPPAFQRSPYESSSVENIEGESNMASQGSSQRSVHQDYITRQRYSNALPPPPGAPKLLEIPSPGINQYTMPHYASKMARAQPLNIEADAFLGMPIDLVGMPGVFDGDESSIQAPLEQPPVHPRDRNLLRPLKSLGKPKSEVPTASFMRRSQYIAEDRSRPEQVSVRQPSTSVKRRPQDKSKEDPINILRSTIKGFDIANPESAYKGPDTAKDIRGQPATPAEIDAWKNPKHPTKPHLKVVDSYPFIPDLDAFTDDNGYAVYKFNGNPTETTDGPDPRMVTALLRPLEPTPEIAAEYQAKMAAHKLDPAKNPHPGLPPLSNEFFLPNDAETANLVARKVDVDDPEKDSSELYNFATENSEASDSFRYVHSRVYEPGLQVDLRGSPYQEVALAIHDPALDKKRAEAEGKEVPAGNDRLQKAAYYYPVTQKVQLKPRRTLQVEQMGMPVRKANEELFAYLETTINSPDAGEVERREGFKAAVDTKDEVEGEGAGKDDAGADADEA